MSTTDLQAVDKIIDEKENDSTALIAVLQDIQRNLKYLPVEAMKRVSEKLNVPESRVYNVATFYSAFKLEPPAKHTIRVCVGTACHVRGAPRLTETLEGEYGLYSGKRTKDGFFGLERVACLGACALAPVVVVDEQTLPKQTPDKLVKNLEKLRDA